MYFDKTLNSLFSSSGDFSLSNRPDMYFNTFSFLSPLNARISYYDDPEYDISYLTEGEEGNRVCKIEWNNVTLHGGLSDYESNFANLQLWLYEDSGAMDLHFGDSFISDPILVFEDPGPSITMINEFNGSLLEFDEYFILDGDPENPSFGYPKFVNNEFVEDFHLDSMPANGTIYKFSRRIVNTEEISELSSQFSVHPNPSKSNISIDTQMDVTSIKSVSILNNNGALMKTIDSDYGNINIEPLTSGVYNIQILTDEGLASKRFVKID